MDLSYIYDSTGQLIERDFVGVWQPAGTSTSGTTHLCWFSRIVVSPLATGEYAIRQQVRAIKYDDADGTVTTMKEQSWLPDSSRAIGKPG